MPRWKYRKFDGLNNFDEKPENNFEENDPNELTIKQEFDSLDESFHEEMVNEIGNKSLLKPFVITKLISLIQRPLMKAIYNTVK